MTIDSLTLKPAGDFGQFAYIRSLEADEIAALPNEALSSVDDLDELFMIINGDGEKLAIVEGRAAALAAIEANALKPISLH